MINLKELTMAVCSAARETGSFLRTERESFDEGRIEQKHSHDYVSYVDKSAEERLVEQLRKILPEAGFVTEEGLAGKSSETYWWVVDPLDGTTNFIHRNLPYAVSVALRTACEVLLGVIYDATADECFYAWKDGGAYLNDNPISVNKSHTIDSALLCLELPYNVNAYKTFALQLINHFYGRAGGIRMNGSAAVALAHVAAGRLDGWIEHYIGFWDYMAGLIIIREAGGKVTDFKGKEFCIDDVDIVASNGVIHDDLVEQTREFDRLAEKKTIV
ncbi:MAG: inositol monophosphatase family protein [Bacteroidales bacterium]|nr:inositol monophosphatase family protein [Bacteroidales bacterium]